MPLKSSIKIALAIVVSLISGIILGWLGKSYWEKRGNLQSPISVIRPRTLDKYTFENLAKAEIKAGEIKIERTLKETPALPAGRQDFTAYLFSLTFDPAPSERGAGQTKKVTGLLNVPAGNGPFPLIVMLRGYVDQKTYQTGDGTRRAGEYFAKNGFATIAPDFLGYGESDKEADDIFETRFQTYTTVLALLNSLSSLERWDQTNIFLWGHSNGGHVALAILEITGKAYPTTLWAPVSQGFPQAILSYVHEADDSGKLLIQKLAEFYDLYDPKLYSITNYFEKVNPETKIQIHQGTADDAVAKVWTDKLVKSLANLDLNYFVYPGADHNLQPAWNTVVNRDLQFFRQNFKIKTE